MQIEYNPALDLCCAMLQYAHWSEYSGANIPGYRISDELSAWHEKSMAVIPALLHNDIEFLISNFAGLLFLPLEYALRENISSAAELIAGLQDLPPAELPRMIFESYITGYNWDDLKTEPEKIRAAVAKAGCTTRKNEADFFLDFIQDPAAFQTRLIGMMADFYRLAVEPYEAESEELMGNQASEDQLLLDKDPVDFFSGFMRMKYEQIEPGARIFISRYSEIDIIQIDNPHALIYGRYRGLLKDSSDIPLEQIYTLLADESRRTILRMLCRRPWFIRELADELNLTSATVSYHMSRLSMLNLVAYEQGERKRVYYSADTGRVEKMMRTLSFDILGKI